jgi:hypothetical protein
MSKTSPISSDMLEIMATSIFQTLGYYTNSNLKWIEDKIDSKGKSDILEIDVFAKSYAPLKITKILVECKNGCDFNDFFKFLGIATFIEVDSKYLICQSGQYSELNALGVKTGVNVLKPQELLTTFKIESEKTKLAFFNRANALINNVLDKNFISGKYQKGFTSLHGQAYAEIRKYLTYLNGSIWKEKNSVQQFNTLNNLLKTNKDFVRKIAGILEIKKGNKKTAEEYIQEDVLCQVAGYVVLQSKIFYIVCAVECAINAVIHPLTTNLDELQDLNFKKWASFLKDNIKTACKIPTILQTWLYVFGGFISTADDKDFLAFCDLLQETPNTVNQVISILKQLFTIQTDNFGIQWGFSEDLGVLSIKNTPLFIRGLGVINRKKLKLDVESFIFKDEAISNFNEWMQEK